MYTMYTIDGVRMLMELKEQIYLSMNGLLQPGYTAPGVADEFVPGRKSYALYSQMLDAYLSVCARLGNDDGDCEVDTFVNCLLALGEEQAYIMYEYGAKFGTINEKNAAQG